MGRSLALWVDPNIQEGMWILCAMLHFIRSGINVFQTCEAFESLMIKCFILAGEPVYFFPGEMFEAAGCMYSFNAYSTRAACLQWAYGPSVAAHSHWQATTTPKQSSFISTGCVLFLDISADTCPLMYVNESSVATQMDCRERPWFIHVMCILVKVLVKEWEVFCDIISRQWRQLQENNIQ